MAESKYNHITLNVSVTREPLKKTLDALALKLNCRPNDLVWAALTQYLKTPPTIAPAEASQPRTGSARGFWVMHKTSENGRLLGVSVLEVASRAQAAGRLFFRYKAGEVKERVRALNQALAAANYDATMTGVTLANGKVAVTELPPETAKPATPATGTAKAK